MAGKEGKLVLGWCTAGQKAATRDETSTKPTLRGCTAHHKSATEPMEVSREDALLKRKAEEEIYHHVGSVAAGGEATEPKAAVPQPLADGGNKEPVSEHQAEVCIKVAVYEPQAEDLDGYNDAAEDYYDYDEDYEEGATAQGTRKEFLPLYGKSDEEPEREEFRAKVRRELMEKGYVEVDEDYYDKKDEYEHQMMLKIQEEWNQKTCLRRSNKE
ncbi:unnamed protein product [Alopecurus aequalis]